MDQGQPRRRQVQLAQPLPSTLASRVEGGNKLDNGLSGGRKTTNLVKDTIERPKNLNFDDTGLVELDRLSMAATLLPCTLGTLLRLLAGQ
jgi:hypothetical protein